jgi:plastocyanin
MDLDSRALNYVDSFAQRFPATGSIRYRLSSAPLPCPLPDDDTFTIEVRERDAGGEGRQHDVTVRVKDGRLAADPPRLTIQQEDVVLWNAPDASTPGFAVQGDGEEFSFSSAALRYQCLYSHAFLTPGDVRWVDANGGPTAGTILVRSVDSSDPEACRQWSESLEKASVVTVDGETVRPERLEVLTGQTVFWAINNSNDITVTDERLIVPIR